jgi:predicted nucleotidyltransferase
MMSKEDQKILTQFSARVPDRFSDARAWAFGSRARGDAAWDSDFDVFVVLCGAGSSCAGKAGNIEA